MLNEWYEYVVVFNMKMTADCKKKTLSMRPALPFDKLR